MTAGRSDILERQNILDGYASGQSGRTVNLFLNDSCVRITSHSLH